MQVVEITNVTGHSPYDIIICDITNTYCYTAETSVISVPPLLTVDLPTELIGADNIIVKIVDSSGCEEIQLISCPLTPTPTPTLTPTPTITPTNATCVCITFTNPTITSLSFSYTNCLGGDITYNINPHTQFYVCGKNPSADGGVIITIGDYCIGNECPPSSPTPTPTNTPTPTLPGLIGSFVSCCDSGYEFKLTNIPNGLYPLSGTYYIVSSGFEGCATYIPSTLSSDLFSCSLIGPQPDCYYCDIAHPNIICPTPTPTPTLTSSLTPTPTVTPSFTPTPSTTPSCFYYRLLRGALPSTYTFNPCCGETHTSPISLSTAYVDVCSSTLPVRTSGTGTISLLGNCPDC